VKEMSKAVYLLLYLEYSPKTAYLQWWTNAISLQNYATLF
jgi:hypothetical protein